MSDTKSIVVPEKSKLRLIHIETKLGVVNIYLNLTDMDGHKVESIRIVPDNGVTWDEENKRLVQINP